MSRLNAGSNSQEGHHGASHSKGGDHLSIMELQAKARELKELKRMAEELDAEITAVEDAIKAAMGDQEHIIAGEYKLMYKAVTTCRIDGTALKKAMPELAERFTKATIVRRFQVA